MVTVLDITALILVFLGGSASLRYVREPVWRLAAILAVCTAAVMLTTQLPIQMATVVITAFCCAVSLSPKAMSWVELLYATE